MGMAASQARYLALTARKTNCEYEGQQINQARTALANQSSYYFNQMLEMQVPDCPDSTDYTVMVIIIRFLINGINCQRQIQIITM